MSKNLLYPLLNIYKRGLINIKPLNYIVRNSSYQTSQSIEKIKETPKYETTQNPDEWKHVERLLPSLIIPTPTVKSEYLSGWKPPPASEGTDAAKYFVPRNKNFMVPVYLTISHRGMKKTTKIRKIQGDIFALERNIKQYLQTVTRRPVATLANELVGYIYVKGDHVNLVKDYLIREGF